MVEVTRKLDKWDLRFLDQARDVASWSKDPSSKIGAVAVGKNRRILSTGYNGFPRGVHDSEERYNSKAIKYKFVAHAELNCVCNAGMNGVSLEGSTLYVHGIPVCHECAKAVIGSGISRVVMRHKPNTQVWEESFFFTKTMFNEAGIEWTAYEDPSLGSGNEPSGQADAGPETERNVPTLRAVDEFSGGTNVLLREHSPSPWSRETHKRGLGVPLNCR